MRAWEYDGQKVTLVERPAPVPGPGQVVLDVTAAGLCHSDLTLTGRPAESHPFPLPLVLGHEVAGTVRELGEGITGLAVGDPVVVHGPWGCGECRRCWAGEENLCPRAARERIFPVGLGADGGLAEQLLVPSARHLVRADGIDPVQAAPLTDAGLTAFNAVRLCRPAMAEGSTVLVLGVGGLGHLALQLVKHLTPARVVAVDVSPAARDLAARLGADVVLDPTAAPVAEEVRALTGGDGADVVMDFVASELTLSDAVVCLAPGGELCVVGVGAATVPVAVKTMPLGSTVRTPYWGPRGDLEEVLALSRQGALEVHTTEFPLAEADRAYELMRTGGLVGRAVVRPVVRPGEGA
ncbi:NAD(P)-dependent alcohol dehydrogenase [Nocardioides deserti]|uniref:alcohol dehydrogenase n=1 Tax=Nocardioides deserti TaxID=1588644 RepID=A0ABR6U7U6_9ACTN|nr:NAD(P)-dependent alcohol dehydrogenase [Nocardioides deserti]MBC2960039.1 NAD(P)-dependent alcohol dehydrogenase [Nocardioides deserti]GGO75113.1 oxidoreductase [Nocardioides deserti]